MRKPTIWVPTRSDTNRAVQSWRLEILDLRNCTICVAKTKALTSFANTSKLSAPLFFAYADCWFSRAVAHCFAFCQKTVQSKLPIRSPLFSVTLQSAVSSGSPRTISNANAPLFSTHLSNAVNGQQKLSQIAKFSL